MIKSKALGETGSEGSAPSGVLPVIAYDTTPSPDQATLAVWAAGLNLPARHWQIVRRLAGRVVALGSERDWDPDLVLKAGPAVIHAERLARAVAGARLLATAAERAGAEANWLAAPDAAAWQTVRLGAVALASGPFVVGSPIAPERQLSSTEAAALTAEAPTLASVAHSIEAFTGLLPLSINFERETYANMLMARTADRLRHLTATDGLDLSEARALETDLARRLAIAPLRPVFGHGELTAWHILRTPVGRLALIDLETAGIGGPAGIDMSVLVMRTWALNGAPAAARLALAAYLDLAGSGAARNRQIDELAWQWPYAALRTRDESRAWSDRTTARSFWAWATGPSLLPEKDR